MEKNNTNKYIVIGVVIVILALIAIPLMRKFGDKPAENNQVGDVQGADTQSGEQRFSGTVSAVDDGCTYDAICSVTIDGKKVILVEGGLSPTPDTRPVGKLLGVDSIGDLEGKKGAFANVYAGKTAEGDYTLYGNSEYFVEITTISAK